ncbi:MAG: hypothetical protein A2816_00325 [Candidatus Yanofskybacteria bacterium RIFCSPHIGHO2_01_FULL_39_44]|nr:MAG: hypothetical protein A2816_00325 [Candidatus Yanofskybacteria bacterium RIFCSPHIGHO2_01_FULL_39_44]
MAKKRLKEIFAYKLLKAIALGGVVIVASTNPYFGIRAMGAFKKDLARKKWWEFHKAIRELNKKKRLNVIPNPDGSYTLKITQVGHETVEKYDLDNLKIERPEEWDGGWRVITFDIPKDKKSARQALLMKLKELGFIMLQKSVWIHPFECRKELAVIARAFEIEPYVYSFEAWGFDNDKIHKLKNMFEYQNGLKLK